MEEMRVAGIAACSDRRIRLRRGPCSTATTVGWVWSGFGFIRMPVKELRLPGEGRGPSQGIDGFRPSPE
jgi:hypothetical protein